MKKAIGLAAALVAGVLLAAPATASVYSNWLHIQEIDYHADGGGYYQVKFDGPSIDSELCGANDYAVIKAGDSEGVATTDLDVDRMIEELHIAQVTGQRVRLWVYGCTASEGGTTRPKAYLTKVKP